MMNTRHNELKSNDLAHWLEGFLVKVQPYFPVALGAAVVIIAVGVVWSTFSGSQNARSGQAWSSLFDGMSNESALEQVAEDYPGTRAAAWALHTRATRELMTASSELFTDRELAEKNLNDAISGFKKALELAGNDRLLLSRVNFGLAQAFEARFDLDEARKHYQDVLNADPDGPLTEMVTRQLAMLDDKKIRDFYGWFKDQEPEPPAPPSGLTPPTQPLSPLSGDLPDLSDLPDLGPLPDLKSPEKDSATDTPKATPDDASESATKPEGSTDIYSKGAAETPTTDPPTTDPPTTDPPTTDPPTTDPPPAEAPKTDPPAAETPKTDPPKSDTGGDANPAGRSPAPTPEASGADGQ